MLIGMRCGYGSGVRLRNEVAETWLKYKAMEMVAEYGDGNMARGHEERV